MEEITLDLSNMQQVTSHVPFFQNPPAMLAVSAPIAIILFVVVLSTKGKKYNWIARVFFWFFFMVTALMVLWLAMFALYN